MFGDQSVMLISLQDSSNVLPECYVRIINFLLNDHSILNNLKLNKNRFKKYFNH
jgi:hypothetical protein